MIIVIGGGPAGFFAAITARENDPMRPVVLLEKNASVLAKVKVSGGGRCNVTHACPDPRDLTGHYPRGQRELLGPFHKWGPGDTREWFAAHGAELKTEPDGRMFPVTDSSSTIVDCLVRTAADTGVEIRTNCPVAGIESADPGGGFFIRPERGDILRCDKVLLATGGKSTGAARDLDGYTLASGLGHSLIEPVPSLFTFRINDPLLDGLAGVSVPEARVQLVPQTKTDRSLQQTGPLLVTHRGLSGPAVLRLSAWGARRFHELAHRFSIMVNWLPDFPPQDLETTIRNQVHDHGKQQIVTAGLPMLPRRLWAALVRRAEIADNVKWSELDRKTRSRLVAVLTETKLQVSGKDTFKEEFVTCGGVPLKEIDFQTMASRVCPGLFLAGEVLDIDGVTGGFNFQSCWTTGYLAGRGMTDQNL